MLDHLENVYRLYVAYFGELNQLVLGDAAAPPPVTTAA
jgi:hypothetical protein